MEMNKSALTSPEKMWESLIDLFFSSEVILNQQCLGSIAQSHGKFAVGYLKIISLEPLTKRETSFISPTTDFSDLLLFRSVRVRWKSWILPSSVLLTWMCLGTTCCLASLMHHVMASSSMGCLAKTLLNLNSRPTLARSMNLFTTFPWSFSRMVYHVY